jgi:cytochrome c-type biogenesis protein CcmH
MSRRIGWAGIFLSLVILLTIGTLRQSNPASSVERARNIAATTKCPVCVGESISQSNVPVSEIIRQEIARQIQAGRSDAEIRKNIVQQYPEAIQLRPPTRGLSGLLWIVPIFFFVFGIFIVLKFFRRDEDEMDSDEG